MESVNEKLQIYNVRVFKWNEELHNLKSSEGLFLFRACDTTNPDVHKRPLKICHLTVFNLAYLSNRDTVKELVSEAISSRGWYSEYTIASLRKSVSEYLISRFQFDVKSLLPSLKKPTIVIVIDAGVSNTTNYLDKPSSTRKRHLSSTERQEIEDLNDDVSTGSESLQKRKVGNARDYKKTIRSRLQQIELSDQEEVDIRNMLRIYLDEPKVSSIKPVVACKPKGLNRVQVAMQEKEFDGRESVDLCPICLDGICKGMVVEKTPCSHMFHKDCLLQWLPKDTRCPMCRSTCATLV